MSASSPTSRTTPPPLDPKWLQHEQDSGLLLPQAPLANPKDRQPIYSKACRSRNEAMLAGRDVHLTRDIEIADYPVPVRDGTKIGVRVYRPLSPDGPSLGDASEKSYTGLPILHPIPEKVLIYLHGGGLQVGDLDSEDLSCRRICKEASTTVHSIDYRLLPDVTAETCLNDVEDAYLAISASLSPPNAGTETNINAPKIVVLGSSSGGQLAAQLAILLRDAPPSPAPLPITALALRCPVTANALSLSTVPERFRELHVSNSPAFFNSLASGLAYTAETVHPSMPLDTPSFAGLPKSWVQVCSNDIYFSDGVCWEKGCREDGVKTRIEVVEGWPHTFWLKGPALERALQAEQEMVKGVEWCFEE